MKKQIFAILNDQTSGVHLTDQDSLEAAMPRILEALLRAKRIENEVEAVKNDTLDELSNLEATFDELAKIIREGRAEIEAAREAITAGCAVGEEDGD